MEIEFETNNTTFTGGITTSPKEFWSYSLGGTKKSINNKPKKKIMHIINNVFKSKENKAFEYFGLGNTKELTNRGRSEFIDFLFEILTEDRKAFLEKIVEAHKEETKK